MQVNFHLTSLYDGSIVDSFRPFAPNASLWGDQSFPKTIILPPIVTFYSANGDEDKCGAKWRQMDPTSRSAETNACEEVFKFSSSTCMS